MATQCRDTQLEKLLFSVILSDVLSGSSIFISDTPSSSSTTPSDIPASSLTTNETENVPLPAAKWHAYETFSRHSMTSLAAGIFAFFVTAVSTTIFMPIEPSSAAETVTPLTTVDNAPSVSVSASTVDFGRIAKVYGERTIRTASNTVTVNAPLYGYELYISTSDSSNNLVRYGTAGSSGTEIIPATPTISTINPTALSDDTWGFAVKKRNTTVNSGSEDVPASANFDTSYPTGDDSNPDNKFSAVPTQDNQLLIAERSSNAENVPTDVYYGVSIKDASIGIYQGTITYTAMGKEPSTHTVTLKLTPGINKITIGNTECNADNSTPSTDENDPEGTKTCEVTLTYGYSYDLEAFPEEGYILGNWSLSNIAGAFSDASASSTIFTAGKGDTTIIPNAAVGIMDIDLNNNGATTSGSTSTMINYGDTTLGTIIKPSRSYTVSGFDANYNNATDAIIKDPDGDDVSDTYINMSIYAFEGWYKEAEAINKIASNGAIPILEANTDYTNANGEWIAASSKTLYAGWTGQAITLPTIAKEGHTCGWTTSTNTNVITYDSGASLIPTSDMVLHGVCKANLYSITFDGDSDVVDFTVDGATVSKGETKSLSYGATYDIIVNYVDTYNATSIPIQKNSSEGIIKGTKFTVGNGAAELYAKSSTDLTIIFDGNGATANGTTSTTIARGDATLGNIVNPSRSYTVSGFDTNYNNASGAILGGENGEFSSAAYSHTSNINDAGEANGTYANSLATNDTVTIPGASYLNIDIYYSTESNYDYLYVFQGEYSGSVTKNMSAGQLYTYNGGGKKTYAEATHETVTVSGNTATFSFYSDSSSAYYGYYAVVTGFIPRIDPVTFDYAFDGWYNSASGGTKIITAEGALTASNGWTDESSRWISSSQTVYAQWTSQAITLPTITKAHHTCGWTTSTNTTVIMYEPGDLFTPTANTTLHSVCVPDKHSLTVYFTGAGVSSVQIRTASGTDGDLVGIVSTSGDSISGLSYGATYYLYPTFSDGSEFYSWKNAGSYGTLSSGTVSNPSFTMGGGDGAVLITGVNDSLSSMQDYTDEACKNEASTHDVYLRDRRDGKVYSVRYINGNCWMTSNLRFTDTNLDSETSNVTSNKTLTYYDLETDGVSGSSEKCYSSEGYNNACIKDSGDITTGVWYNHPAASAMTITGSDRKYATEDICPKNWRLPLTSEQRTVVDYKDAFNPGTEGIYNNGSNPSSGVGAVWWSNSNDYYLYYYNGNLDVDDGSGRYGYFVRCIQSSYYDITFNGDSGVANFTIDGETVGKGSVKSYSGGLTYEITVNYVGGYDGGDTPLRKNSGEGAISIVNEIKAKFTVGKGVAELYASTRRCEQTISGKMFLTRVRIAIMPLAL